MLKLLLGGSGSGKNTLLYQRIRARAEAGEKSILLVPDNIIYLQVFVQMNRPNSILITAVVLFGLSEVLGD